MTNLTPIDEAISTLLYSLPAIEEIEPTPLAECLGRVLAEDFTAPLDVPPHTNSAMDGYALRSEDVKFLPATLNISQRIIAGSVGTRLESGEAARIFTGAPLPEGADCVAMQENCRVNVNKVEILKAANPGENLRLMGEDIKKGSIMLESGVRLTPQDLGLVASVGRSTLDTRRRLKVALITTGNELIEPGKELLPGQIYNSNYYALSPLLRQMGCDIVKSGIVDDSFEKTKNTLEQIAENVDCVITTGGVSVGEEDHVKAAVEENGYLDLWKLAIKPGKPFASGKIMGKQFFGLPGNPVSAFITFLLLVKPCLLSMLGSKKVRVRGFAVKANFSSRFLSERQEYIRVRFQNDETGAPFIERCHNQSSGVGSSLAIADGLAVVPPRTEVSAGDFLEYISFAELLR
tara:strand:- start:425 stop:1639 length:1215 start_codon:yes stop_codon:yes gene_type:complete